MSFVRCRGAVHFYERGPRITAMDGAAVPPTLVFVNGLGTDYRIWDAVVDALPARQPFLRYDMRGHGLSDVGEAPYAIEALSDDLRDLITALDLGAVVLCGLSLGSLVARALAVREPGLVRALVLCGSAARIGTAELWQERAERVAAVGLAPLAPSIIERWFSPLYLQRDPAAARGYRNMLERMPEPGYTAALHALARADDTAQLTEITQPTLVIAGELDIPTPGDAGRALAALIPGARFALLPGAAHLMCVDEPRGFAHVLLTFLGEMGIV